MHHELLPVYLRQWCVAGGFAACPALAENIDLWVLNVPIENLQLQRAQIMLHLAENDYPLVTESDNTLPGSAENYEDEMRAPSTILKVGRVKRKGYLDTQIMVTDARDAERLLEGFDISTHAVAITSDGRVVRHPQWTPVTVAPVALLMHKSTPDRMTKIAVRYGHVDIDSDIPF